MREAPRVALPTVTRPPARRTTWYGYQDRATGELFAYRSDAALEPAQDSHPGAVAGITVMDHGADPMSDFAAALQFVLAREGGFVD